MAVYYVNSGAAGSATGLSWTDAWTTIDAAFTDATNPVVAGDVVLVHSAHAETNAGTTTIGSVALNPSLQNHVWIISVNKDSSNAITSGASVSANTINVGNTGDIGMSFVGVTLTASDQGSNGDASKSNDTNLGLYDCTCGMGASANTTSEIIMGNSDAGASHIFNITLDWNASGTALGEVQFANNMKGVTFSGDTTLTDIVMNYDQLASGQTYFEADGCDFSNLDGGTVDIFTAFDNEVANSEKAVFTNIHLPTGFDFPGAVINKIGDAATMYNASTGSNLYGVSHAEYGGTVTDDTATYLNADLNGTGFSLNYVGNANTKQCCPVGMDFPLCEFWADANATIKINFTTVDTLDKGDTWIYIGYPDATDASLRKWISTRDFKGIDTGTLGTPGSLTTNSASWTSGKTNKYEISQTLTSSAGPVIVYFMSAQASVDIFVDPEPEIS